MGGQGLRAVALGYLRAVPVTTKSTSRLPHSERTSRSRQIENRSGEPFRAAVSAGVGLDLMLASFAPDD